MPADYACSIITIVIMSISTITIIILVTIAITTDSWATLLHLQCTAPAKYTCVCVLRVINICLVVRP